MTSDSIPRTGRIGRFANVIEKELGEKVLINVMQNSDKYDSFKPPGKSNWWKRAVEILEKEVGQNIAEEIMKLCGERCCGKGIRKTAKRLMSESNSLEEFLVKASTDRLKEGEVEYKLTDKNTITGTFNRCFCKQVSKSDSPFKNRTYCQCSAEFHKKYFEAALERSVDVSINQSIISGAENCVFTIHIGNYETV
jgi:predicted hydrocarbon binding protein